MKTEENKQIEELLERFFEGRTSNEEERALYDFFARADLPPGLESYKELFGYFEKGIAVEFREMPELTLPSETSSPNKRKIGWAVVLVVAASILALLVNTFLSSREDPFNPYEGSFIVHNGQHITDPERIQREIGRMEVRQERMERLIREIDRKECLTDMADIRVEKAYTRLMEDLSDDMPRGEIRRMLESDE